MTALRQTLAVSLALHTALVITVLSLVGDSHVGREEQAFTISLLTDFSSATEKGGASPPPAVATDSPVRTSVDVKPAPDEAVMIQGSDDYGGNKASSGRERDLTDFSSAAEESGASPPPAVAMDSPVRTSVDVEPVPDEVVMIQGSDDAGGNKASSGRERDLLSVATVSENYSSLDVNRSSSNSAISRASKKGGNDSADILSIRNAIEKAKHYPPLAKRRGIEGTVTTKFSINTHGYPQNIKIVKSSGYRILDSAAQKTIVKAAPFPVVRETLEIPIIFRMKKNDIGIEGN
jgi:TonB family protein